MREEAEDAEAVVHRNDDDALFGEVGAVLARLGGGARGEAAAIDPDHDGELVFGFAFVDFGGRPDVEVEAVFARARVPENHVVVDVALHAARAELGGFAGAFPFRGFDGRLPAEIADGRLGEWDAEERGDGAVGFAFEFAGVDLDGGCGAGGADGDGGEQCCEQHGACDG